MTDLRPGRPDLPEAVGSEAPSPPVLRLGVLGTLVWDRILGQSGGPELVEEWGGISYAMEALSVALPEEWVMSPILKVGEDLAGPALDYLASIPRLEMNSGVQVVPFPNHRVELRYHDQSRRSESLSGGTPPWTWEELEPLLRRVDALYLNFITGLEMGVETARHFRDRFPAPLYADLHSLFQGLSSDGQRFPRELPHRGAWLRVFDAVQMNEQEFELLGRSTGNPWELAAETVGPDLKLIAVTLGPKGGAFVAAPEFTSNPESWPSTRSSPRSEGATRTGLSPLSDEPSSGDPTGCGDVWGATFFARLLGGDPLEKAMVTANRMAAKKVEFSGARGLRHHLRGVLAV